MRRALAVLAVVVSAIVVTSLVVSGCGRVRVESGISAAKPDPFQFDTTTDSTTTVPAPTTTSTVAPATITVPPAAAAPAINAGASAIRLCSVSAAPSVLSTELATPNRPGLAYSATPGGPPVGTLQEKYGGPSTRPVVAVQGGWVQVRLNTRPNESTGWVAQQDVGLSATSFRIVISICQRSLTLFSGATALYSAPVGVGRPQWPTPIGPSFVDSIVSTPRFQLSVYGPTVLLLGTHSNVFTEFDGGDGVVSIHGYPSDPASTRGVASSHGCVRAGPATIDQVKAVPVGTPVDIVP